MSGGNVTVSNELVLELQKVARGKWLKVPKVRQAELVDMGLVRLDEYDSPEILPDGNKALKGSS